MTRERWLYVALAVLVVIAGVQTYRAHEASDDATSLTHQRDDLFEEVLTLRHKVEDCEPTVASARYLDEAYDYMYRGLNSPGRYVDGTLTDLGESAYADAVTEATDADYEDVAAMIDGCDPPEFTETDE